MASLSYMIYQAKAQNKNDEVAPETDTTTEAKSGLQPPAERKDTSDQPPNGEASQNDLHVQRKDTPRPPPNGLNPQKDLLVEPIETSLPPPNVEDPQKAFSAFRKKSILVERTKTDSIAQFHPQRWSSMGTIAPRPPKLKELEKSLGQFHLAEIHQQYLQ